MSKGCWKKNLEYFGINNHIMDSTKKLTFENMNKINGVADNLIKRLKVQVKIQWIYTIVEQIQKKLSELGIQFKKSGWLTKSASIVFEKDYF